MINVAATLNRYANLCEFAELSGLGDDDAPDSELIRKALALQVLASQLVEQYGNIGDLDEDVLTDLAYEDVEAYALSQVNADTRKVVAGLMDQNHEP